MVRNAGNPREIGLKPPPASPLPFALNLIFNFAFTPLQFGLKNNPLASIDITLVLITLIWAFASAWPKIRWVVYTNIPYLLWACFATVLQFAVTALNWGGNWNIFD